MNRKLRVRGDLGKKLPRRGRGPTYDAQAAQVLVQVCRLMDYICGKRLAPALASWSSGYCGTTNCV